MVYCKHKYLELCQAGHTQLQAGRYIALADMWVLTVYSDSFIVFSFLLYFHSVHTVAEAGASVRIHAVPLSVFTPKSGPEEVSHTQHGYKLIYVFRFRPLVLALLRNSPQTIKW